MIEIMDRTLSRRKVVMMTTMHEPDDTRIYKREALTLSRAGFDVHMVAPQSKRGPSLSLPATYISSYNARLHRLAFGLPSILIQARRLRAQIYHFHDPELLMIAPFLRSRGAKVVYDVHENLPNCVLAKQYIYPTWRPMLSRSSGFVESELAKIPHMIVAASTDIAKRFVEHPLLVRVRNFAPRNWVRIARKKQKLPHNGIRLGFCGGLGSSRGLEILPLLLDELNRAGKYEFWMCGKLQYPRKEKTAIDALLCRPDVTNLGFLPNVEESIEFLANCDAGLYIFGGDPNLEIGPERSNKLFQFMAAGLPVITSDYPAWRSFIESTQSGIVVPCAVKSAAALIHMFCADRDRRTRTGLHAQNLVDQSLNWEGEASVLIQGYNTLTRVT